MERILFFFDKACADPVGDILIERYKIKKVVMLGDWAAKPPTSGSNGQTNH